jgi:hypothetical protein
MPKLKHQKFGYSHNNQTKNVTKASIGTAARSLAPLFNKDLGQHILKNPLVAQGIVEKVLSFFLHIINTFFLT